MLPEKTVNIFFYIVFGHTHTRNVYSCYIRSILEEKSNVYRLGQVTRTFSVILIQSSWQASQKLLYVQYKIKSFFVWKILDSVYILKLLMCYKWIVNLIAF